jgi:hypothetical protein
MNEKLLNILEPTECLSSETIQKYFDGNLSKEEMHEVERHLVDCEICNDELEGLALLDNSANLDFRINRLNQDIRKKLVTKKYKKRFVIYKIAAVAALFIAVGSVVFVLFGTDKRSKHDGISNVEDDKLEKVKRYKGDRSTKDKSVDRAIKEDSKKAEALKEEKEEYLEPEEALDEISELKESVDDEIIIESDKSTYSWEAAEDEDADDPSFDLAEGELSKRADIGTDGDSFDDGAVAFSDFEKEQQKAEEEVVLDMDYANNEVTDSPVMLVPDMTETSTDLAGNTNTSDSRDDYKVMESDLSKYEEVKDIVDNSAAQNDSIITASGEGLAEVTSKETVETVAIEDAEREKGKKDKSNGGRKNHKTANYARTNTMRGGSLFDGKKQTAKAENKRVEADEKVPVPANMTDNTVSTSSNSQESYRNENSENNSTLSLNTESTIEEKDSEPGSKDTDDDGIVTGTIVSDSVLLSQAHELFKNKEYTSSEVILNDLISSSGQFVVKAKILLAKLYIETGEKEKARKLLVPLTDQDIEQKEEVEQLLKSISE